MVRFILLLFIFLSNSVLSVEGDVDCQKSRNTYLRCVEMYMKAYEGNNKSNINTTEIGLIHKICQEL